MKHLKTYKLFESNKLFKINESAESEEDVLRKRMLIKYGDEKIENCDSTINNIKDMLLELQDLRFDTVVEYSPFTLTSLDSDPKIYIEIIGEIDLFDSNYDLIKTIVAQIREYTKDNEFDDMFPVPKGSSQLGITTEEIINGRWKKRIIIRYKLKQ